MIVIGTDEAGYGPNLGPLVVTATVWSVPSEDVFPKFAAELASRKIRIDDSKKVFRAGDSLASLESAVMPVLTFLGMTPEELIEEATMEKLVAPNGFYIPSLSATIGAEILEKNLLNLALCQMRHGVDIQAVRSRAVFPREFNRLLDRHDSKGSLLSETTMELIRKSIGKLPVGETVLVLCDKHGGRNRYLDWLTAFFPGEFFQVVVEGREKSVYRMQTDAGRFEFRFLAKGDSQTPVALASLFSKYLRELAMLRFNEFWARHVPDLKPTAGYPEDARRFKEDIAAVQRARKIADDAIWRKR